MRISRDEMNKNRCQQIKCISWTTITLIQNHDYFKLNTEDINKIL